MQEQEPHPIKLVLMTHFFPAHRGGVEIVAGALARRLVENGRFQIRWFSSDADQAPDMVPGLQLIRVASTTFIEKRLGVPYPIWSPGVLPELWRSIRAADVVHLHDFIYCGNLVAFAFAKAQSKPVLVTQHIGFIPYDNPLLRGIQKLLNRTLGALILGRAHSVVFISEVVRSEFSRFVKFKRPPRLVFNGVDLEAFSPISQVERDEVRSRLGIDPRTPIFLFVGRFVEKKGLSTLKELARVFGDVRWLFAGHGPIDPESWGLPNVTIFRDKQGAALADLYRAADLFVLPSKGEGFPLVVQEAMACGTPALIAGETMAAIPGLEGLCFSENVLGPDVLMRWRLAIEALLPKRDQLGRMRDLVASFARSNWSWNTCAVQYAALFTDLAQHSKEAAGPAR